MQLHRLVHLALRTTNARDVPQRHGTLTRVAQRLEDPQPFLMQFHRLVHLALIHQDASDVAQRHGTRTRVAQRLDDPQHFLMQLHRLVHLALACENASDVAQRHGTRTRVAQRLVHAELLLMQLHRLVHLAPIHQDASDVAQRHGTLTRVAQRLVHLQPSLMQLHRLVHLALIHQDASDVARDDGTLACEGFALEHVPGLAEDGQGLVGQAFGNEPPAVGDERGGVVLGVNILAALARGGQGGDGTVQEPALVLRIADDPALLARHAEQAGRHCQAAPVKHGDGISAEIGRGAVLRATAEPRDCVGGRDGEDQAVGRQECQAGELVVGGVGSSATVGAAPPAEEILDGGAGDGRPLVGRERPGVGADERVDGRRRGAAVDDVGMPVAEAQGQEAVHRAGRYAGRLTQLGERCQGYGQLEQRRDPQELLLALVEQGDEVSDVEVRQEAGELLVERGVAVFEVGLHLHDGVLAGLGIGQGHTKEQVLETGHAACGVDGVVDAFRRFVGVRRDELPARAPGCGIAENAQLRRRLLAGLVVDHGGDVHVEQSVEQVVTAVGQRERVTAGEQQP